MKPRATKRAAKAKARAKPRATKKPAPKKPAPKKPAPKKPAPKKPAPKKPAPRRPASTKPRSSTAAPRTALPTRRAAAAGSARIAPAPRSVSPPAGSTWRDTLRAEVEKTGDDFAAYLRSLGATGWEHADTPELAGLEQWGTQLALRDRVAGVGALVRTALHGLPLAIEEAGVGFDHVGIHAHEPAADGAPVETQLALAAAWLDAPDAAHRAAVAAANDPSRQLQIWDDDLRPNDDRAHWWYLEVGQCCGHAITRAGGDPRKDSYYDWPPETCVGRGLVVAVRGLRSRDADLGAILAGVRRALVT